MNFLKQFADDTDTLLADNEESFKQVLEVINNFCDQTGLKINYDKTTVGHCDTVKLQCIQSIILHGPMTA